VAASGTVAIYDLAAVHPDRWRIAAQHEWPTVLERPDMPWSLADVRRHWINLTKEAATSPSKQTIAVKSGAWIGHRLEAESPGGLCCVKLDFWSDEPTDPLMEITWYDAEGNLLSRTNGAASGQSNYAAWVYAIVPPNAKSGWVYLREWRKEPIHLKSGAVTFWKPPTAPATARHDKPYDKARGVR